MNYATLQTDLKDKTLVVTLDRAEQLNTLNPQLIDDLTSLFESLHKSDDIRIVILRAAGRAFCAGLDLGGWKLDRKAAGYTHSMYALQRRIARIMQMMRSCPQPVIGLGHGAACGGGFSLLLSCDIRYAAPSLRMNAAYIKIGLGGCDMGASYLLPRLVGMSLASELLLTGRFIHADRALAVGLVSGVVPEEDLLETGLGLAAEMLKTSPLGLRMTKDALNFAVDAPSMAAAMAMEDRQQIILVQTEDAAEAVNAFLEKRAPHYHDQ